MREKIMKEFFDRKTFDPINNEADKSTLNVLRQIGARRMRIYSRSSALTLFEKSSAALQWIWKEERDSGAYLDLGCGDSPDALIMQGAGFAAQGVDLFPPREPNEIFIKSDVVERIPFSDGAIDLISSQAMLDLIEPVAREQFFREVNRVLKVGGIFACYIQWLQSGWGFDLQEEQERASKVWDLIHPKTQGFVVIKGEQK